MGLKHSHQFIENPKHFFECFYPPTPDEFIWKQHPVYPELWANNAGYLEWRDGIWEIVKGNIVDKRGSHYSQIVRTKDEKGNFVPKESSSYTRKSRFSSWGRLVYECFMGEAPKGKRILRINHNIFDDRPTNFAFYVNYPDSLNWLKEHQLFITNTHREMWKREQRLPLDTDAMEYFRNLLCIPWDYAQGYEKFKKQNGYIRHGNYC